MATRKPKATNTPAVRKDILTNINKHFFPDRKEVKQVFIFLTDTIAVKNCDEVMADLINLNSPRIDEKTGKRLEPEEEVINLFINSSGGDLTAAFALVNMIEASTIPVRTIAMGECCSAALVLFMSGHQRVITPNTSIMSHQLSTGAEGTYGTMKANMYAIQQYHDRMIRLYEKYTGLSKDVIENNLLGDTDTFLTPEEALSFNICDLISDLK